MTFKERDNASYIRPALCNELHDVIGYVPLNINLLLLSRTLKNVNDIRSFSPEQRFIITAARTYCTLTTEAPVANFFPSFFEASLSLTPDVITGTELSELMMAIR